MSNLETGNRVNISKEYARKSSIENKISPPMTSESPSENLMPDFSTTLKSDIYRFDNNYHDSDSHKVENDYCSKDKVYLDDAKKCFNKYSNLTNMKGLKEFGKSNSGISAMKHIGNNFISHYHNENSTVREKKLQ